MSDEKTPIQSDGWKQWSQSVKESLEKLEKKVDKLEDRITKHREESLVELSTLKAKAGIMGMIAGLITSTIMSIIVGLIVYHLTIGIHQTTQPNTHVNTTTNTSYMMDKPIEYVLPDNTILEEPEEDKGDIV